MNKLAGVFGIALCMLAIGCKNPYKYKVDENVKHIDDPYAIAEYVKRAPVKVAVRPAKKNLGKKNIDEAVCAQIKDRLSQNSNFDIAVRDDLSKIKVEDLISGGQETDLSVVPSELLVLVDASVTKYLGGTNPGAIAQKKALLADRIAAGDSTSVMILNQQLGKMAMKSVEDPNDAFGVTVSSSCSAYNCQTLKQYVSDTTSGNYISDHLGRPDVAIDDAAKEIADSFMRKLKMLEPPPQKLDYLVEETRRNGDFLKVNAALYPGFPKLVKGGKAHVYTHKKNGSRVEKKELAEGEIVLIEESGCVWVLVEENFGYGNIGIGHCVYFN